MLTDIEIAQQTKLIPIDQLAHEYGLSDDQFIPYGRDKAKVALDTSNPKGKLILVTATSGMPAGSGKTTTSIAVAQAFKKLGEKACLALREPSLGPSFGMKGGAAGGGYSQVVPMESINLHFTGDFHAITAANNLLAALIDNARHQGQVDLKEITWRRVLDVNDRMLQQHRHRPRRSCQRHPDRNRLTSQLLPNSWPSFVWQPAKKIFAFAWIVWLSVSNATAPLTPAKN